MIANVPRDHARAWTQAGNDQENWTWQHKDLHARDSFDIDIVETNWSDPFPIVEQKAI